MILEADGFADLHPARRVHGARLDQDERIIDRVRAAKAASVAAEARLDKLEARQSEVTADRRPPRRADPRDQGRARRPPRGLRGGALQQQTRRSSRPARTATSSRATSPRSRRSRPRSPRASGPLERPATPGPVQQGSGRFIWPVNGTFTSPFGYRWGRLHAGIDIAVPEGTPLRAADGGSVAIAGWTGGYGNYTCINHGERHLHLLRPPVAARDVSVGQSVSQGQVIGYSGNTGNSTGPHLHFEVRINGNPGRPRWAYL